MCLLNRTSEYGAWTKEQFMTRDWLCQRISCSMDFSWTKRMNNPKSRRIFWEQFGMLQNLPSKGSGVLLISMLGIILKSAAKRLKRISEAWENHWGPSMWEIWLNFHSPRVWKEDSMILMILSRVKINSMLTSSLTMRRLISSSKKWGRISFPPRRSHTF